jgi:Coenzyme PQQ synthesis protein D (PqqD)
MTGAKGISLQSSVKIPDDVVYRDLEGEAVILNLETGVYFGLNQVGTRMWALIQEHGSLGPVFDAIQKEYEVPPAVLERDLLQLVADLRGKRLVTVSGTEEAQGGRA